MDALSLESQHLIWSNAFTGYITNDYVTVLSVQNKSLSTYLLCRLTAKPHCEHDISQLISAVYSLSIFF